MLHVYKSLARPLACHFPLFIFEFCCILLHLLQVQILRNHYRPGMEQNGDLRPKCYLRLRNVGPTCVSCNYFERLPLYTFSFSQKVLSSALDRSPLYRVHGFCFSEPFFVSSS